MDGDPFIDLFTSLLDRLALYVFVPEELLSRDFEQAFRPLARDVALLGVPSCSVMALRFMQK